MRRLLLMVAIALLACCRATRPSQLPTDDDWVVAVKSCALPEDRPWWMRFAHHAFLDLKRGPDGWERIESFGRMGIFTGHLHDDEAHLDHRFGNRPIRLLGYLEGEDAKRAIAQMDAARPTLVAAYEDGYRKWPGPNSNTFVHELALCADDLGFVFDPNSLGKDYASILHLGRTASKTGIRLDTPVLGAAVGLREGVELHFLQTTLGISLDPPGISIPFLPQIPFGWFGADTVLLEPTAAQKEGAALLRLPTSTEDGVRRDLGSMPTTFRIVIEREDRLAYSEVLGTVGPPHPGLAARDVDLRIVNHEQDGTEEESMGVRLDPTGPPQFVATRCGGTFVVLELQWTEDARVAAKARAFATQDAAVAFLQEQNR